SQSVFTGVITEIQINIEDMVIFDITAYSDAIKLTEGPRNILFETKKTDTDIITKILEDHKIKIENKAKSQITHQQYFAWQQTPWQIMMARVLTNGFLFVPQVGKNQIIDPRKHKPANTHAISIEKKQGLQGITIREDARSVMKKITATGWDIKAQQRHEPITASFKSDLTQTTTDTLQHLPYELQIAAPISPEELKIHVEAEQIYRTLDSYQGTLTFDGETLTRQHKQTIKLGDVIKLQELGKRYSGNYLISGIQHQCSPDNWQIILTLGVPLNHTLFSDWMQPPPVPPLIGKIAPYQADPEKLERIPVWLPSVTADDKHIVWARLLSPFASQGEGLHLPPSPDDEVIVGFIGGDSRHPVILGATHNPKHKPPIAYDKDNAKRGLFFKDPEDKEGTEGPLAGLHFDHKQRTLRLQGSKHTGIDCHADKHLELHYTEDSKTSYDKGKPLSHIRLTKDQINLTADKKQTQTIAKDVKIKVDGTVTVETPKYMEVK
ncbi:MAG: phage baseplate assembly protein V, partial [Pseudomonadota bacterium]